MTRDILYIAFAYLCGNILFAKVIGSLLKVDVTEGTADGNPGTMNAFIVGGFWCGLLTLCGDLLKGFLTVYLYLRSEPTSALAIVIAMPVIGHNFPMLYRFHGGKGIATTFGCLLGLAPNLFPAAMLAIFFIFFSLILRIMPHYYRTLVTYMCTELALLLLSRDVCVTVGFTIIFVTVLIKMLGSGEEKGPFRMSVLWKR